MARIKKAFMYLRICELLICMMILSGAMEHAAGQTFEDPSANTLSLAPPSPNASSQLNASNIGVNQFTGAASVNIPLYSFQKSGSGLSVNISLGYHGGGIGVEELSGSTGLGWGLSEGGVIVRNQVGLPDDDPTKGYLFQPALTSTSDSGLMDRLAHGCIDGEQDMFYYTFNGHQGAFVIGKDWKVMTIPDSKIRITIDTQNMSENTPSISTRISSFVITDENGAKYVFDQKELTAQDQSHTVFASGQYWNQLVDSTVWDAPSQYAVSSWYLSKIISPFDADSISFTYESYNYSYAVRDQETEIKDVTTNDSTLSRAIDHFTVNGLRIKQINISASHSVLFTYADSTRADIPGTSALTKITITDGAASIAYNLGYSFLYYSTEYPYSSPPSTYTASDSTVVTPRLLLKSITESGGSLTDTLYQFNYMELVNDFCSMFPGRFAFSQDYWGYDNGQCQHNKTLIPSGNSRNPSLEYDTLASLKRITNQFGGYTEYDYGQNDIFSNTAFTNQLAGGIRVAKIVQYDGITHADDIIKEFKYVKADGITSSGFGAEIPNNTYNLTSFNICNGNTDNYLITTSISDYPLLYVNGSPVGYSRVEEILSGPDSATNGKIVSEFTSYNDVTPFSNTIDPPYSSKQRKADWCYGLLKKRSIYDAVNREVSEENYGYHFFIYPSPDNEQVNNWLSIKSLAGSFISSNSSPATYICTSTGVRWTASGTGCSNLHQPPVPTFITDAYTPVTGRVELDTTINTHFYPDGSFASDTTYYSYDPNTYNLNVEITSNSTGENYVKHIYYPYNYTIGSAIGELRDSGIISVPVSTETWLKQSSSDSTLVAGGITNYQVLGNGNIKPYCIYKLATAQPLNSAQVGAFNPAVLNRDTNYFKPTAYYNSYASQGNLLQTTDKGGNIQSDIWSNDDQYVIAKVQFAAYADIAYTSFEASGNGNWIYSGAPVSTVGGITGTMAYSLASGAISKPGLTPSTNYIVSYWLYTSGSVSISGGTQSNSITGQTSGGWTFHEVTLTGATSVSLTGSGYIDELRLYPAGAEMTTYTYQPLAGMTSSCSTNNKITTYDYDGLGRLLDVKDGSGNIVKTYQYHSTH